MIVAIVQARMASTRLPGKVLADIHGKPLLARLLDRLEPVESIDEIVVATSTNPTDDLLVDWLEANRIKYFRGSEDDVLDRYYRCAREFGADIVVRVTADDPLKDASIISRAISLCVSNPRADYVSNTLNPTFPEGLDIEVVRMGALECAYREAELRSDREHVMPYIWARPERFNLIGFEMEPNRSDWRWTVDKPADLEFVRQIFGHFIEDPLVDYLQIIRYIDEHPDLLNINRGTVRNEGLLKSIAEEQR